MKKSLYLSMFLAVVSMVSALVLSLTNSFTAETIKKASIEKENKKLQAMFNEKTTFTEETNPQNEKIEKIYKAEENGEIKGYVYSLVTKGYGGKIKFFVAVDESGKYLSFNSLEHNETPGFGTKMDEPKYKEQFKGKDITEEVDGISGATVTSKGLQSGFTEVVSHFEQNYKK